MIKLSLISQNPSRWEPLLTAVEPCTLHMGKPSKPAGIGEFPLIALDLTGVRASDIDSLRSEFPNALILGLGSAEDTQVIDRLIDHSAVGIVGHDTSLHIQKHVVARAYARHQRLLNWQDQNRKLLDLLGRLTRKEQEVFIKSCTYDSAPELAAVLGISTRTIEAHRYNLTRKVDQGSFREWTLALRLALTELADLGFRDDALLGRSQPKARRRLMNLGTA